MVGKFVFGMLAGGALVAGGFIIGSAMAPLQTPPPANDPAPIAGTPPQAETEAASEAPAETAKDPAVQQPQAPLAAAPDHTADEDTAFAAEAPATVADPSTEATTTAAAPTAADPSLPAVQPDATTANNVQPDPVIDAGPTVEVEVEAVPETALAEPAETAVAEPAETAVAEPAETAVAEPAETAVAEPAETAVAEPAETAVAEPAETAVAEPAETAVAEPAETAVAEPAETAVAEAAAQETVAPLSQTTEPVASDPDAPVGAKATPGEDAEAQTASDGSAALPAVPETAPAMADGPATETEVAKVPAPVEPAAAPAMAPLPLPQLATDGVLAALDRSATEAEEAPVVVAEALPGPQTAPAPEALPDVAPEVIEETPPVSEDGMVAPPLDDEATARLPGTAASQMPGNRPATLPGTATDDEAALPEPEVATLPEGGPEGAAFAPSPGLGGAAGGVVVGRLPRIGDAPTDGTAVNPAEGTAEAGSTGGADPRPIVRFAASFANPEAKPVLAIVLIDNGSADLDRAGLAALPFPVSFALDPLDPATPDRAAIYRAAGREVVMLATGIADGAQASDIEVAFQSMAQGLPEAVAVMDLAEAAFQNRRPLASLVVPVLGAQGRGLLTWDQGLNAADQVARREDIAAAVIFRDLTSAGEDGTAIRRVLDRAVFKAGQDGRVTVAANATPETVATLLEWTVEGRAATVAIGPLTAVMAVE